MLSNVALKSFRKAEAPPEIGTTIPRAIRMGVKAVSLPPMPPTETVNTRDTVRFVPRKTKTVLTLTTGQRIEARIVNMSSLAVAVEADLSSVNPTQVKLAGARPVRPGRRIALGAVFLFNKPIPPEICNEHLVL